MTKPKILIITTSNIAEDEVEKMKASGIKEGYQVAIVTTDNHKKPELKLYNCEEFEPSLLEDVKAYVKNIINKRAKKQTIN